MKRAVLLILLFFAAPSWCLAQDWQYMVGKRGMHKAIVVATGHSPDGTTTTTTLTLGCVPRKDGGSITLSYGVRNIDQIKPIDLSYYEGPDAPAQHKSLFILVVHTQKRRISFRMKASGAFSDLDNSKNFQFDVGKAPPRLIGYLSKGIQKITVRIVDDRRDIDAVYSEFLMTGSTAAVRQLTKLGCR